jgi:DNA-binding transcriptional LysR family regulator
MLHGRLLRYLDEVVRCGSIRKAAARLNVASSAINRQLLALEDELGTPIFERMPRGLRLTTAGEILVGHIRETLRGHERALGRIEGLKGLVRGEVTIATMGGLATGMLADVIREFRVQHPAIKLTARVLPRDAIVAAVLAGEADLGLGYNLPANARLRVAGEFQRPLGAVVAPAHPLAGRASVTFAECLEYPLVLADRGMTLRDAVELLVPPDTDLRPVVETNALELMKSLARSAPHVALLNRSDVEEEARAGTLAFVPLRLARNAHQKVHLVHRAKGILDGAANLLAMEIQSALERHGGDKS